MVTIQVRAALLATTAALTILASANAAGPNMVGDFGFESGAFAVAPGRWANTGGANEISDAAPISGAFSFLGGCNGGGCVVTGATGVTGTGTISQQLNLQPGIYAGSLSYRTGAVTPYRIGVSLGNNVVVSAANLTFGIYNPTFISAVSGGSTPLVLGLRSDISFDRIDDVSVRLVDDGQGNNIAAASQTVAVQASRDFLDRLHDRFGHAGSPIATASVRETVLASADGGYVNAGGKYRAFMSVFGSEGDWDDSYAQASRRGLSAGFEFAAGRGIDLGVAVALSQSNFRTRTVFTGNHGDADEYLGAVYAHWSAATMPLYLNVIGGYGQSSTDFARVSLDQVLFPGGAEARDVDTMQWFASGEVGWDWVLSQRFRLTPFARVDAAWVEQDGYAETASGAFIPAVVAGRKFEAVRSVLGVRAEADLNIGRRGTKVGAKVGWAHEFEDDRFVTFTETTPSLVPGTSVTFAGVGTAARPDKDSVVAGANIEMGVSDDASLYVGYNGSYGDTTKVHAGEVGLRVTW